MKISWIFHLEGMASASVSSVELTENDIPGAMLEEPLESVTMPALRWWLLCRGIQVPTSLRKAKLLEKSAVRHFVG